MRRKYNLMPTDPRWLELSTEDVIAEYYAHQYAEHGVPDEVEDENFDAHLEELEKDLGLTTPGADVEVSAGPVDEFEEVINDRRN